MPTAIRDVFTAAGLGAIGATGTIAIAAQYAAINSFDPGLPGSTTVGKPGRRKYARILPVRSGYRLM